MINHQARKNLGLVAVALALVLALVVGGCVPAAPVEKERVVKIGWRALFTGAIASTGVPYCSGGLDYYRYVNEQGGIEGIPIEAMWEDNASMGVKEISTHKRFAEAGVVAEITVISSGAEFTTSWQQKDKVPLMSWSYYSDLCVTQPIRWVFAGVNTWNTESAAAINLLKAQWRETRPPRFGIVLYDHPSGWSGIEGVDKYCTKMGVEYVGYEVIPLLGAIDTTVEHLRLAGKKPDLILYHVSGASLVLCIKDAYRLELQKRGITLVSVLGGLERFIINAAGADACEGWYTLRRGPCPWETGYPGLEALNKAAKKYRGWEGKKVPEIYSYGWLASMLTLEGVRLALEKVGIENLNGSAVRDGLASISEFDTGLLPYHVSVSESKPWVLDFSRTYKIRDGLAEPTGDWFKTPLPQELGSLTQLR